MFGKHKKSDTFDVWLGGILKNFDLDAKAFNFNIYENKKDFSVEFVATSSFDPDDEDWACDEIYASRNDNNEFYFDASDWESAEEKVQELITEYLKNGEYSHKLKSVQAVACGFVDGDLTILFPVLGFGKNL